MSGQVYSIPDQTEGRRKAFLEWTYPLNYLLHVGVMLTIKKVLVILSLLVGIGNILVKCPVIFSSWPN